MPDSLPEIRSIRTNRLMKESTWRSTAMKMPDAISSRHDLLNRSQSGARELAKTQHPFAAIVCCSDSRVPPEIVFDQGLGDLFIVRVAGNVINDEGLGQRRIHVDHLGTRLILVLGHQRCGAVDAARETIAAKGKAPGHIQSLVTAIKPAVEATAKDDLETTVKANVKNVVKALRSSTPILKAEVDSGEIQVVGGSTASIRAQSLFSTRSKTEFMAGKSKKERRKIQSHACPRTSQPALGRACAV